MAASQAAMVSRQLEMQLAMRDRMMAVQVATARDTLMWYGGFASLITPMLLLKAYRSHNPLFLAPLVPLSFVCAYTYDLAYHTKLDRILAAADGILAHERHLLRLPGEPLSVATLDAAIASRERDAAAKMVAATLRPTTAAFAPLAPRRTGDNTGGDGAGSAASPSVGLPPPPPLA